MSDELVRTVIRQGEQIADLRRDVDRLMSLLTQIAAAFGMDGWVSY